MFEVEATGRVASQWGDPRPDAVRPALYPVPAIVRRNGIRYVVAALAIVFLAINGFAAQQLLSTRHVAADLAADRAATDLEFARQQANLTALRARIDTALNDLEQQTKARDDLSALDKARREQAAKTASELRAALTQIYLGRAHASDLDQCLLRLQAALNTASVGDKSFGPATLAEVERVCQI
jgi:hypothetical protein